MQTSNLSDSKEDSYKGKKILIDTTFLFDQYSFRGIGKYGKEVVKRLVKLATDKEISLAFVGFLDLQKNLIELGFSQFSIEQLIDKIEFFSLKEVKFSTPNNLRLWSKLYKPIIEKYKPNIYFSANFERGLPSVNLFSKRLLYMPKTIVMAHDVIPLVNNSFSQKSKFHNYLKGIFYKIMFSGIKNANIILTNSEFTKKDLIKFGVDENKIKVIYLGIDESFEKEINHDEEVHTLKAYSVESKNYFVYDSGLETNKGILDLVNIFKEIISKNNENLPKKLLLIGKDFTKGSGQNILPKTEIAEKYLKIFKQNGILENIVTTDRVSDEDLVILIKNAFAYFNFSKYEGFGFGPVQAMLAKVITIAGNYSCTPEITNGGAFLVDSQNHLESANKIVDLLTDSSTANQLIKTGFKVAKTYDWDITASKTFKEIESLL